MIGQRTVESCSCLLSNLFFSFCWWIRWIDIVPTYLLLSHAPLNTKMCWWNKNICYTLQQCMLPLLQDHKSLWNIELLSHVLQAMKTRQKYISVTLSCTPLTEMYSAWNKTGFTLQQHTLPLTNSIILFWNILINTCVLTMQLLPLPYTQSNFY